MTFSKRNKPKFDQEAPVSGTIDAITHPTMSIYIMLSKTCCEILFFKMPLPIPKKLCVCLLIILPILAVAMKNRSKNRDKVVDEKLDPFKEEFFFRRQVLVLLVPQMGRK